MQTIAIVGRATDTNCEIVDRWRALELDAVILSARQALAHLISGDVALGRLDVLSSLAGIEPGLDELIKLQHRDVRVLNRAPALLTAHDKLVTARRLNHAGVPHPQTVHVRAGGPPPCLRPPVVVKPRFGSWGRDVLRCDSRASLRRVLHAVEKKGWYRRSGALVQTLVPPVGHDLRILVAGGEVVGAEERVAGLGEWRTNISLGGFHRPAVPPPAACELAVAAATAVGTELCGVDLLPAGDGYVVIEVNGAVDFTAGYSQPGEDVFERLAVALDLLEPPYMTAVPAVGSHARARALTPLVPSGNGRIETMSAER